MNITLKQMQFLDAMVREGSFHGAARKLNKTHPSLITALKNMEDRLGFAVFDRSGYRTRLTDQGRVFHKQVQAVLHEVEKSQDLSLDLAGGQEAELRIVLGDITPLPAALQVLKTFMHTHNFARLNLLFENLYGSVERLLAGDADLIIHHLDEPDHRLESKDYAEISILPVIAPGFISNHREDLHYADLQGYSQCIIKDTATAKETQNYFVLKDQPHILVGDQATKREIILQGMGWGHMPDFLVHEDIDQGRLVLITGAHIKAKTIQLKAIRRADIPHGPMAQKLWEAL
jgi:DNA-binding transcriptional LysR family regulator